MIQHLRLLNPFVVISSEPDARMAARAGAVGLFVGAAQSLTAAVVFFLMSDTVLNGMRRSMIAAMPADTDPDSLTMVMRMIPSLVLAIPIMSAVFGVVYAVLGAVQWRKLTQIIPLLVLLLAVLGFASSFHTLVTTPPETRPDIGLPLWYNTLSWTVSIVELCLLIVGFRGGSFLHKLQRPAPVAV